MHLTQQEQQQINELVTEVEAKSGAQVLVAVIGKADAYPEIPWKAFAVGAAVAALFVMADALLHPDWASLHSVVFDVVVVLGAGAALGLLTIVAPPLARMFPDQLCGGPRPVASVHAQATSAFRDTGPASAGVAR